MDLGLFLVQFLFIVGGAAVFRRLVRTVGQPSVIGELALGFVLGPTILGLAWPQFYQGVFSPANRPFLEALGWIGLILFIYSVGAELHWTAREAWPIFFVALGGLFVPFVLGSVLALSAPQWFFPTDPSLNHMILMGCIMSVSALAVLGRLLADMKMLASRAASLSLGASTIDDVVAWILLAIVVGSGEVGLVGDLNLNLLIVAILFGAAVVVDRYVTPYFVRQAGQKSPFLFVVLLFAIFASALLTHQAGLHALFGAFAVGGLMSRHPILKEYTQNRMGELTAALFLPAFFVLMGMNVDLTVLQFPEALGALALLVAIASVGKIAGAFVGGRAMGVDSYTSFQVGILLNNRGAVDLVVAKVGYDAGLLSTGGFSLLVMMIALTTLLSPVVLGLLNRFSARRADTTPGSPQDLEP